MDETKVIYHIDEEEPPYLMKIPVPTNKVTLGDLKNAINKPNYKYFFKSMDDDFGVVKEEITEDHIPLPFFNGRVIAWLVPADGSAQSDSQSNNGENVNDNHDDRGDATGTSRPPSFQTTQTNSQQTGNNHTRRDGPDSNDDIGPEDRVAPLKNFRDYKHAGRMNKIYGGSGGRSHATYDTSSSMMSSDLESTSFFDSEDESSRFSTTTGTTMSSKYDRHRKQRRRRRLHPISRASSFSSVTDSTMTLNVITVTLNMDTVNFLGISIVGQSDKGGDGGIYVGSIMKGGAVALDGRIEPGDMILEVNGTSFENMSNDEAVRVLREQVQKPGPITLVVAKCWDPNPKAYLSIPRQEPVRPIDPRAWVLHTNAMTGAPPLSGGVPHPGMPTRPVPGAHPSTGAGGMPPDGGANAGEPEGDGQASGSSSVTSSLPESDQRPSGALLLDHQLTVNTDMITTVRALMQPDSGLEVRDRMWLKIRIPKAFIGSDLVEWLMTRVNGFADRRDARKYACNLLKYGYIRHTVNKITFSEQCYYVFGDIAGAMSQMNLEQMDSLPEGGLDADPLHPPHPMWQGPQGYYTQPQMPFNPAQHFQTPDSGKNFQNDMDGTPPSYINIPGPTGVPPQSPSVVSGSVVANKCVCINSIKSLWDAKKKFDAKNQSSTAPSNSHSKPSPTPNHAHSSPTSNQKHSGGPSYPSSATSQSHSSSNNTHPHQSQYTPLQSYPLHLQHHSDTTSTNLHQQQFPMTTFESPHLSPYLPNPVPVSSSGDVMSSIRPSMRSAGLRTNPVPTELPSMDPSNTPPDSGGGNDGHKGDVDDKSGNGTETGGADDESTAPTKHAFLMCQ